MIEVEEIERAFDWLDDYLENFSDREELRITFEELMCKKKNNNIQPIIYYINENLSICKDIIDDFENKGFSRNRTYRERVIMNTLIDLLNFIKRLDDESE